jgi:large subunit ribosomal protein L17
MKHHVSGKKLGRTSQMRQALFKSLASGFIIHGKIETTSAKAKAVRPIIEKLAGLAKQKSLSSRRRLQSFLQNPAVIHKILTQMAVSSRSSGFTRLLHTGIRRGDRARLSRLEWSQNET